MRKIIFILTIGLMFSLCGSLHSAFSQMKYSIKEMTPSVQSALEQRRDRYDQIKVLKQAKSVGENNRGYLTAFVEDEAVQTLINQENANRKTIYVTIAEQNGISEALETIEKVFAQTQRDNAEAGEKIQFADGSWGSK